MKKLKAFALALGTVLAATTLWSCGDDDDEPQWGGGNNNSSTGNYVSPTSVNIGLSGGAQYVTVSSPNYTLSTSDSWINAEKYGSTEIRIQVDGYKYDRSGYVYVRFQDGDEVVVAVNQSSDYGAYPTPDNPDTPDNPSNPDTPTTNISAPKGLKIGWDYINNDTWVYLNWNMAYGKNYTYKVYRSTSANGSFSMIESTQENSIADHNVSMGKTYYYKVKAFDSNGNSSDYSETVNVTLSSNGGGNGGGNGGSTVKAPNRPVITSVTASSSGRLTVKWKMNKHATCDDPDGYKLLVTNPLSGVAAEVDNMGKSATSVSFAYGMWLDNDGWVKGGIRAYNDGGSETAVFVYNHKTGETIFY